MLHPLKHLDFTGISAHMLPEMDTDDCTDITIWRRVYGGVSILDVLLIFFLFACRKSVQLI